jgi:hypothetical protein
MLPTADTKKKQATIEAKHSLVRSVNLQKIMLCLCVKMSEERASYCSLAEQKKRKTATAAAVRHD